MDNSPQVHEIVESYFFRVSFLPPPPRDSLSECGCLAADIGQTSGIIVTGGDDELSMGFSNKAFFYDIELEHWTELRELPQPRAFHNMGLIGEGVG